MSEDRETPQASWNKTERLIRRLESSPRYRSPDKESPYGYFDGRKVIGRDAPVNRSVYLSSDSSIAIVVDDEKFPSELNAVYQEFQLESKPGSGSLLEIASKVVAGKLGHFQTPNGEQEVEDLERQIRMIRREEDPVVPLNLFVKKGMGVCKHRALLVGYLLERMVKEGKLKGRISVDRNTTDDGGHAWVRYRTPPPGNKVFIVDPSLNFVGSLKKAEEKWAYQRPNESRDV